RRSSPATRYGPPWSSISTPCVVNTGSKADVDAAFFELLQGSLQEVFAQAPRRIRRYCVIGLAHVEQRLGKRVLVAQETMDLGLGTGAVRGLRERGDVVRDRSVLRTHDQQYRSGERLEGVGVVHGQAIPDQRRTHRLVAQRCCERRLRARAETHDG